MKHKNQRQHRSNYRERVLKHGECWCGRKAVAISRGSPACQRCLDIESRLDEITAKDG